MKFPPWWGYGYFLELHNLEKTHQLIFSINYKQEILRLPPLQGKQKYQVPNVDVKSKIVSFACQHIEFNSFYNKTQFGMVLFCCQQ